jgi:putative DNA-binding protein
VPTLLDLQHAMCRAIVAGEDGDAALHVVADGIEPAARLKVYRSTFLASLTAALRLSYPAVHRLVGEAFFEGVAQIFVAERPPRSAYLDEYGADFAEFLARFPPAASVPYLADVARLEWAVNRALHAPDTEPLDLARLAALAAEDAARLCLVPQPSVGLLRTDYPADAIWRAVLDRDDRALSAIDLAAGPAWLLVERVETGVEVLRMSEPEWRFMVALCWGRALEAALDASPHIDAPPLLASHLAAGRFIAFAGADPTAASQRMEASP